MVGSAAGAALEKSPIMPRPVVLVVMAVLLLRARQVRAARGRAAAVRGERGEKRRSAQERLRAAARLLS